MTKSTDRDARDAILRRRRTFVAVALASAGLAAAAESCTPPPQPCLDVAPVETEREVPVENVDAGVAPKAEHAAEGGGVAGEPAPTSSEKEPAPRACLDFDPGHE